ncbi:MAG: restriction endonuclease [Chloroflexi bacterium]|nr:restriction endonuclease [Chloroflexota bacterium]
MKTNVLYYGDNLDILRRYVPDESVDLVYLDPPFNSNRDYNVIFRDESGRSSDAQMLAFEDTWHWGPSAEDTYLYLVDSRRNGGRVPDGVSSLIAALRAGVGTNQLTAYLVEMTVRLLELRRVLKPTGSLYLHCDPTASAYLKVVLDGIFGPERFLNEVVWRRTGAHGKTHRFGPIHDTILVYTKTAHYKWRAPKRPYMRGHVAEYFVEDERGWRTDYYGNVLTGSGLRGGESGQPWRGIDPSAKGRHWAIPGALIEDLGEDVSILSQHQKLDRLLEMGHIKITPGQAWPMYERYLTPGDGQTVGDIWAFQPYTNGTVFGTDEGIDEDVRWLSPRDKERLGWQTQKPGGLLERIIAASSDEGDVVLDPFCGCGTALVASQRLGRRWLGIDITYLSIAVMRARLRDTFLLDHVPVIGQPTEVEGARQLAQSADGRYQFQWWALGLVDARPVGGVAKKGADQGIDGVVTFTDVGGRIEKVLVSVKSGGVNSSMIRDLKGTLEREKAAIGLFITLEEPSEPMRRAGVLQTRLRSARPSEALSLSTGTMAPCRCDRSGRDSSRARPMP